MDLSVASSLHGNKITADKDLEKILNMYKHHQVSMFRASKKHATGTYHGNQRHGMLVLNV